MHEGAAKELSSPFSLPGNAVFGASYFPLASGKLAEIEFYGALSTVGEQSRKA